MFRRIRQDFNQGGVVTPHDAALSAPSYTVDDLRGTTGIPRDAAQAYIESFNRRLATTGTTDTTDTTDTTGGIGGLGGTTGGTPGALLGNPLIGPSASALLASQGIHGGLGAMASGLSGGTAALGGLSAAFGAFAPALVGGLILQSMMKPKKGPEHYAADANQQFQQLHSMTRSELNDPVEGPKGGTRTGILNTDRLMANTLQNALYAKERGGANLLHPALQGGITDLRYFIGPRGAEGVTLKSKPGGRYILGADAMREYLSLPEKRRAAFAARLAGGHGRGGGQDAGPSGGHNRGGSLGAGGIGHGGGGPGGSIDAGGPSPARA